MSLADIKLDRQRKRNEAADASLTAKTAPTPLEKRQTSRTKGKWKPFDCADDFSGGVSVETRVNTYSRTSSLSRPISALSHRTDESTVSDASGFQMFTGRKNRRQPIELRPYSSEKPQTTVEAPFDKREIYEVFGNALPAPEYLEQNVGYKNGQVHFLQHPNGDVSAQQWSASRYEWVNLGQFSNIRKRVEGQLASDRLKGEMAHHTLQQNTLQYFRTIAKQREAMVLGSPFGPKEVEAALPMATTAQPSRPEKEPKSAIRAPFRETYDRLEMQIQDVPKAGAAIPTAPAARSPLPPNVPREPAAQRWEVTGAAGGAEAFDPFYPATANPSASCPSVAYGSRSNYTTTRHTHHAYSNIAQSPHRMGQSYQFPPVPVSTQTMQSPGAQKYFADRAAIADRMQSQWRQVYGNQPSMGSYGQPYYSYRTAVPDDQQRTSHEVKPYEAVSDREIVAPQPRSISSIDRSAMRHTLHKLGETAKERNLSQANIRTVLHDPFHSPPEVGQQQEEGTLTATKDGNAPLHARTAASKKAVTQSSPLPSVRDQRKCILQESSPDTQWTKRPYEHSTPLLSKSPKSKATSQGVVDTAPDTQGSYKDADAGDAKRTHEEHLNDWWTNGSTFARQEDLYQAIAAAQAADSKLNSPPAHLTPIGPPSRNNDTATASFNETTTRLLLPVWESLASYVDRPAEKVRDYWCPWGPAPEWCIDRSPDGNKSFFEADWGSPPQRVGRDPRYNSSFDGSAPGSASRSSRWQGVDQRFAYAGRY